MKCENCGKEHEGSYGSGRFCCQSCARSFSTKKNRLTINNKISKSLVKIGKENYNNQPKLCCICNNVIPYQYRKRSTCSNICKELLLQQQFSNYSSLGGLSSAKSQQKRSKNEIAFCTECEKYFGEKNVLHNEPIFNGWDADIILPQYKVAILWNGPWHYRQIARNHKLKQVQNRDQIKINEIRKCGYKEYIIKDNGKYNLDKVLLEFNNLLDYLNIKI